MTEYHRIGWENLMELTGLSIPDLLDEINSIGITVCLSNFALWRQYGTIPPEDLVRICNHFRYPITNFSRIAGRELEAPANRLFSKEEWQDIKLAPGLIIEYTINLGKVRREDAIRRIGCSAGYYDAFRKYPSTPLPQKLTYAALLNYIANAKLYPGDIIIDPNESFPMEYNVRPRNTSALATYNRLYPTPHTAFVAEEMINMREFLYKYFTQGKVSGGDKVIATTLDSLNEMAGIIDSLRRENDDLRRHVKEVEDENANLKESINHKP